jgi:cell division protein FtsQ
MAKKKRRRKQLKKVNNKPALKREWGSTLDYIKGHKSLFIIGGMVLTLLLILIGVYRYIVTTYTITTVYVEGNVHYTNEEIMDIVMEGRYGHNSLLLSMKYKDKSIENVPFVEKMDVSVLDPHTIKIEVYEKALAGYVEYLERYMYFDRDGIVVESSLEKTQGIPLVTGLHFDHVILHEPLPVENPDIFQSILSITQLVNKYELSADRIHFGSDDALTLYFKEVKVALGSGDNLDEKVMTLQYMLPEIEGKSGVLRMENYTEETKNISFEPD